MGRVAAPFGLGRCLGGSEERRSLRALAPFILPFLLLRPIVAHAAWSPNGDPICTAAGLQYHPVVASDGAGGAFVSWWDFRGGATSDIYTQRIDGQGVAQWAANGVVTCSAAGNQNDVAIMPDGAGGAIEVWSDLRNGADADVYAQRIDASGAAQWTANGVAICAVSGDQAILSMVSDGAGGAIVSWSDFRGGVSYDIYAQRIDASGAVQWTANGVPVCTAVGNQLNATIASDGAGGAIVTWPDPRVGLVNHIYAQRIDASGAARWAANGVLVCSAPNGQFVPEIVSDGVGGAVIAWQDDRSGTSYDIYAQRVNASGVAQWAANGVSVCSATRDQQEAMMMSDGAGGAIITWDDYRTANNNENIYVQRIDGTGTPSWTADGVALCTAVFNQYSPMIASDGAGGAIVTWTDGRGASDDIYAQRVDSSGAVRWPADGVALESAPYDQYSPSIVADGTGGAIVAYVDYANGDQDIYAQRVGAGGTIPTGVAPLPVAQPSALALAPSCPNPFVAGAETRMSLLLPSDADVTIEVFDALGRRERHTGLGFVSAGSRSLRFDGRDDEGRLLPSGVYFYRVRAAGDTVTRKLVVTR
ncbi:MAG: FlgD immunoglobulin-like domain containing protein [bacterium]